MGFNSERGDAQRCEKGELRRCWMVGVGETGERGGGVK